MAGPAQRFNSNIIKISFPSIGGLIWFRVAQRWEGDVVGPAAKALVEGLPWDDFDMFSGLHGEDPDGTPEESVPVGNPVTDKMISKYLWWSHRTPVHNDGSVTLPSIETYVIDTANYIEIYNHTVTNRLYPVAPRDVALAYFKGPGLLPGQDPDLVGVQLGFGDDLTVPSPLFFIFAAEAGWTYHIETSTGTAHKSDDAANVIINLAKLFRDVPNDPVTGKKPAKVEFTITIPKKATSAGKLQWWIQAAAFKSKLTKPPEGPKDDERRDYPVHDRVVPISGIPGATNTDYLYPTFEFDDEDKDESIGTGTEQKVFVTITFGVGKIGPKVEVELAGGGGGEG